MSSIDQQIINGLNYRLTFGVRTPVGDFPDSVGVRIEKLLYQKTFVHPTSENWKRLNRGSKTDPKSDEMISCWSSRLRNNDSAP